MARLILHGIGRSGTTVTQRIINSHSDVWMTNEFLLYDMAFGYYLTLRNISTPRHHFKTILYRGRWSLGEEHNWQIPPTLNLNTFADQCLEVLSEDSPRARILAMEQVLYGNGSWKYFGDKVLEPETLKHMLDANLPYKVVYIYRDARDNVASRRKHNFPRRRKETRSEAWAECVNLWFKMRDLLDEDDYIELRFEDYINFPGKNGEKLEQFLGLTGFVETEKKLIKPEASHIGAYKERCPDWRKTFHPEAIRLLKKLKYTEDY